MFNKKNNSSKSDSEGSWKHPFIKNIREKLRKQSQQDKMRLIMEHLRSNNFVFSNN
ncbi:hypothetical protein HNP72_001129 [Sphingobacterium soli]|uniref:hypothetical protein n=1 Tax=Sphingobacterium cellulitidis TaxID=1768011 RepID=UPI0015C5EC67|nr:hypothetical protein [Sphingobacterium cellulitidis]MBA8985995.1 hypothetical protein [Sphingobacterium soli]